VRSGWMSHQDYMSTNDRCRSNWRMERTWPFSSFYDGVYVLPCGFRGPACCYLAAGHAAHPRC
jgi:hypothetical protein